MQLQPHLRPRNWRTLAADTPLYDMLKLFEMGRSHMAVLMQLKKGVAERQRRHRCAALLPRCCCSSAAGLACRTAKGGG